MSPHRTVARRVALELHQPAPGFTTWSLRSTPSFSLDPFLSLDDFVMSQPTFPPHPHAGFSAVTYMFEDSGGAFLNRDSLGDRSHIEPGAIHWTQAGRGMMHEEIPEHAGEACHGLQMFVNLQSIHKSAAPAAYHASRGEVPEVIPGPGARVRVLAGTFRGVASSLTRLLTPITFLEVHLAAGATVEVEAPPDHNAFAMVIRGSGIVAGEPLAPHEAARFAPDGERVAMQGGNQGLQALVGIGRPLGEPVVFGGPFVMNRHEEILEARARFGRGEMGTLTPSFARR